MKKIIKTKLAPEAVGPYSQAVDTGSQLFVSGQIPIDPETSTMVEGDVEKQTMQVMKNLKNIIEAAGYSMSDVVKCTCLLSDISDFKLFNSVYADFFKYDPPARATFQVAALPLGALVEVDAIAVK